MPACYYVQPSTAGQRMRAMTEWHRATPSRQSGKYAACSQRRVLQPQRRHARERQQRIFATPGKRALIRSAIQPCWRNNLQHNAAMPVPYVTTCRRECPNVKVVGSRWERNSAALNVRLRSARCVRWRRHAKSFHVNVARVTATSYATSAGWESAAQAEP